MASSLRPAKHLASQKSGRFEPDKFEELAYYETALIDPHPSKARRRADHAEKNRKAREFATFARSFLKGMEQLLWWCGKRFCRREMRPRPGLYRSETPARLTNSRLRTIGAEGPASRSGGLARRRPSVFNLLPAYCPSANDLRLIRRFEKGGSGSSGLEFKRPAADAASGGLRWLYA